MSIKSFTNANYFEVTVASQDVRREKEKARALRKTQWWQRQIAKEVCYYCQKPTPAKELTMDHIVPLIRNGRSTKGNVVPACKECNSRKKYLLPIEWEEYIESCSKPSGRQEAINACDTLKEDPNERM